MDIPPLLKPIGTVSWEKTALALQQHFPEEGFSSLDEWQSAHKYPLFVKFLGWYLFEILEPATTLQGFWAMPVPQCLSSGSIKKDIFAIPLDALAIQSILDGEVIERIREIQDHPPPEITLVALLWHDRFFIIDGLCESIALAGWGNEKPFSPRVSLILADWNYSFFPTFKQELLFKSPEVSLNT